MEVKYKITSRFGDSESFRTHAHNGLDFAMPENTELRSIQNGIVERVVNDDGKLGNGVYVQWADGKTAIYGHMNEVNVKVGDHVKVGDLLGYSGNSGNVIGENGGYHLHLGIIDNGEFIDPSPYAPLIQEMNYNLTQKVKELSQTDVFNQAMSKFSEYLSDMSMNLIYFTQSLYIHTVQLIPDSVAFQIDKCFSFLGC